MNRLLLGSALFCAIVLSFIDLSTSECCHVPLKCTEGSKSVERCYDCTEATIYCGVGKCNVLGCNCDGGCRKGDSSLWCWNLASQCVGKFFYQKVLSFKKENEFLSIIDTNFDGFVSFSETESYLTKYGPKNIDIEYEFNQLDTNGDGFLSMDEIDS